MKYRGGGGVKNAGLEYNGQKWRAAKCRTGKWRTKVQGWKTQDWKMTEIKSAVIRRHILVAWHDKVTPKQETNTLMFCIWHCSHVRRVVPLWYCSHKRRHAALALHSKCEHGFEVHRIVAITALWTLHSTLVADANNTDNFTDKLCFAVWCCLFFHWFNFVCGIR